MEIQKIQPLLPVIVVSAEGNIKFAVEAMRRGAMDFVEKPFLSEQFHAVLARVRRTQHLVRRIEKLEQEVTESRAERMEPIFDFTVPSMREVMDVNRAGGIDASLGDYPGRERHWQEHRRPGGAPEQPTGGTAVPHRFMPQSLKGTPGE